MFKGFRKPKPLNRRISLSPENLGFQEGFRILALEFYSLSKEIFRTSWCAPVVSLGDRVQEVGIDKLVKGHRP